MLISWNVTKVCNLYCKHCYRSSGPDAPTDRELTTEEGKQLLSEIRKAGFRLVILSGGEPLMREDLFELIAYASSLGLRTALGSNGTLITKDVAVRLKAAGLAGAAISLDSHDPSFHNDFRNRYDAWEKAIEGIRRCQEAELDVQINMTLSEDNASHFSAVADLAEELNVRALHPFFLVPTGRGTAIEDDMLRQLRYFDVLRAVLDRGKKSRLDIKPTCAPQFLPMARDMELPMRYTRGCLAGLSYCCILPDGEVHICPYLPVKAGSVREAPFDEIWRDSEVFNQLRDYSGYGGACGSCSDIGLCGGCRARAYRYHNGDYMAEEPWCYKIRTGTSPLTEEEPRQACPSPRPAKENKR
ncbi:radical SAM/SPASM domain-containing protein [Gorillibacterium timonense]|uniref:radical SAM/SPASM domain-containing protein n=1 Tax=Gorillibacterium timonense TaxID=1689269 RepID=UPI0009E7F106|nr:radical SAM protein [Gorillibacterium timonense]